MSLALYLYSLSSLQHIFNPNKALNKGGFEEVSEVNNNNNKIDVGKRPTVSILLNDR